MPVRIVSASERKGLKTDCREMLEPAYGQAHQDFLNRFRTSAGTAPSDEEQYVPWSQVADLVRQSGIQGFKGLVFYYGLDENAMRYGLRVVEMRPMDYNEPEAWDFALAPALDTGAAALPTHEVDPVHHTLVPVSSDWNALIARYRSMEVDRNGNSNWHTIDPGQGLDPLKIVFPWEDEVFELWQNNRGEFRLNTPYLVIRSISIDHQHEATPGYRHGLGLHMRYFDGGARDLVGMNAQVLPYHNAAADLGHRCPPRCQYYKFEC